MSIANLIQKSLSSKTKAGVLPYIGAIGDKTVGIEHRNIHAFHRPQLHFLAVIVNVEDIATACALPHKVERTHKVVFFVGKAGDVKSVDN